MPELRFTLHLPDGTPMECWSPSTILRSHMLPGTYDMPDFLARARRGFAAASDRVRNVHGHPCSQAAAQLHAIEAACRRFAGLPTPRVTIDPY
jgi:uncharacterized repeat protein (TIGR04042 family)